MPTMLYGFTQPPPYTAVGPEGWNPCEPLVQQVINSGTLAYPREEVEVLLPTGTCQDWR